MNDKKLMNRAADNIRILAASMVEKAKSGHPGGAMGGADFINILFSEFLVFDPEKPEWAGRDRFYLDPGHMSPMLYAASLCYQGVLRGISQLQLHQLHRHDLDRVDLKSSRFHVRYLFQDVLG